MEREKLVLVLKREKESADQTWQNQDKYRRAGRRCSLGDGIDSIPCYFALGYDLNKRINISDHPVNTTPNHTLPKWMFSQKLFFKSALLHAKWLVRHLSLSLISSDDLCLPICIYPSSMRTSQWKRTVVTALTEYIVHGAV